MQSAYFSYPRDFVGTTRQARRRLAVRGHADFRATPVEEPTELHLNLRNPAAPGGLGSSLAPATRSHVAIPSRRETNRFLSFLRVGLPRFSLPSLSYPSAFYRSPAHFCAHRCSPDRSLSSLPPPWPHCPRPAAVDSAKFFSDPSPFASVAIRTAIWRATQGNKKKRAYENIPGENKAISWRIRSEPSSEKDKSINLKYQRFRERAHRTRGAISCVCDFRRKSLPPRQMYARTDST